MHLNGEKNASCLSRTPKICTRLQIFQSNLPFSHQSSESHLVGPYSNLSGPNPTGWRCTMCPRGRQFSSDKISLKGSKSQKFRRTAFMPPHLYSGVLERYMALFGAKVHTTFSLLDSYIPLPEVAEHDDRTEKTRV